MTESRVPPHSEEAERGLLGAALLEPTKVLDLCIQHRLYNDAFYVPTHKLIYTAMGDLLYATKPIDTITVIEHLKQKGNLDKVGGAQYLDQLVEYAMTPAHAEHYIAIISEKRLRRNMIQAARDAENEAYESEDAELSRSQAEVAFTKLHTARTDRTLLTVWEEIVADVEAGASGKPRQIGIDTGYPAIDQLNIGGMRPGSVYWLTGKQKVGKTRLKANMKLRLMGAGRKVGDLILEGTLKDELERMANIVIDAQLVNLMLGTSKTGLESIPKARARIIDSGLFCGGDRQDAATTTEFRSWARRKVAKEGCEILFLDYLQRLQVPDPGKKSMEHITAEKVECVDSTVQELGVPLVCLAALNDKDEVRGSRYADYTGSANWVLTKSSEKTKSPAHWSELTFFVKEARYAGADKSVTLRMKGITGVIEVGGLVNGDRPRESGDGHSELLLA